MTSSNRAPAPPAITNFLRPHTRAVIAALSARGVPPRNIMWDHHSLPSPRPRGRHARRSPRPSPNPEYYYDLLGPPAHAQTSTATHVEVRKGGKIMLWTVEDWEDEKRREKNRLRRRKNWGGRSRRMGKKKRAPKKEVKVEEHEEVDLYDE